MKSIQQFGEFCALIRDRIGVELPEQSRESLDTFLASRTKELGYQSIVDYLQSLYHIEVSDPQFQELVDVTTNGKTLFFRHFDQLKDIRDLMVHCWKKNNRPPSVWSAGCATGEEVYSLAMLADEAGVPADILGTDVCKTSLLAAEKGCYGGWQLENTGRSLPNRYFTKYNGQMTVIDAIKHRVRFQQHNLLDSDYPRPLEGCWDIVLCRNVFIYFHRDTVLRVLEKMKNRLAFHGMLFISPSESIYGLHDRFKLIKVGENFGYKLLGPGELLDEKPEIRPPVNQAMWLIPKSISSSQSLQPQPKIDTVFVEKPKLQDEKKIPTLMRQAVEAHQRSDFLHAVVHLKKHIELEPADWIAKVTLGNVYMMIREYAKSLEQYVAALDSNPLSAETHFFLGLLYRKTSQWDQAITALKQTLFLDGSYWLAAFYLARLYAACGQHRLALREYQHTLHILGSLDQKKPLPLKSALHELGDVQRYRQDIGTVCRSKLKELSG